MQCPWLKLVLIFVVTIQQTVAGVSCCCLVSNCVAPRAENVANTQGAKPFCNKCKSKAASTKSEQRQQGCRTRLGADTCNCKISALCIATDGKTIQFDSSKSKKYAPLGAMVSDIECHPDDLLVRISLMHSRLAGLFELAPAPKTTLARLSILNSWVI
jgi:hypothetical protein